MDIYIQSLEQIIGCKIQKKGNLTSMEIQTNKMTLEVTDKVLYFLIPNILLNDVINRGKNYLRRKCF